MLKNICFTLAFTLFTILVTLVANQDSQETPAVLKPPTSHQQMALLPD